MHWQKHKPLQINYSLPLYFEAPEMAQSGAQKKAVQNVHQMRPAGILEYTYRLHRSLPALSYPWHF